MANKVKNYAELGSDSVRSEEESSSASMKDWMAPDSLNQDQDLLLKTPETLDLKGTAEGTGVPIFNISESDVAGNVKNENVGGNGGSESVGRKTYLDTLMARQSGKLPKTHTMMKVGELNATDSFQGTTVSTIPDATGSFNQFPPLGGQMTKADGLSDEPRGHSQGLTQNLTEPMTAREPPRRESRRLDASRGQKTLGHSMKMPQESGWHNTTGGVDKNWETTAEQMAVEERANDLLQARNEWWFAGKLLNEAADEASGEACEKLERVVGISKEKTEHLRKGGEEGLAKTRDMLSDMYQQSGLLMPLLMLDTDDWIQLKMQAADMAPGILHTWRSNFDMVRLTKKNEISDKELYTSMKTTNRIMPKWEHELKDKHGEEKVDQFIKLHIYLFKSLERNGKITEEISKYMPTNEVFAIKDWYVRWSAGLLEMDRQETLLIESMDHLSLFLDMYPGPTLEKEQVIRKKSVLGHTEVDGLELSEALSVSSRNHRGPPLQTIDQATVQLSGLGMIQQENLMGRSETFLGARSPMQPAVEESPEELGYNFRAGSQPAYTDQGGLMDPHTEMLTKELEKSKKALEDQLRKEEASVESDPCLPGFEGMYRDDIQEWIRTYVTERLEHLGKWSPLLVNMFTDYMPKMGIILKSGRAPSIVSSFKTKIREMTPYVNGDHISMVQWWRMLNQKLDVLDWPISLRIVFLEQTGGLAPKHQDNISARVKHFFENPKSWLPDYDQNRMEDENREWLTNWLDIGLKLVAEFHSVQNTEDVENELTRKMKESKYEFVKSEDPLNENMNKVHMLWQDVVLFLEERSSDLISSPMYVWKLMKEWLLRQGVSGKVMGVRVEKAMNLLATNPESVLPKFPVISPSRMSTIRQNGAGKADLDTYKGILDELKAKAGRKELVYELSSLTQFNELIKEAEVQSDETQGYVTVKPKGKSSKKVNSTVTTNDCSSLTLNTNTSVSVSKKEAPSPCTSCGMFHDGQKDNKKNGCTWWDADKKKFHLKNFISWGGVRQLEADGSSTFSPFWHEKLTRYGFRAMKLEEADQKTLVKEIKNALAKLPKATVEEVRQYKERNKKYANSAAVTSTKGTKAQQLAATVMELQEQLKALQVKTSKKPKRSRRSRSSRVDSESESSGSEPELVTDSSSGNGSDID
jgi:hypothetical protein